MFGCGFFDLPRDEEWHASDTQLSEGELTRWMIGLCESDDEIGTNVASSSPIICYCDVGCRRLDSYKISRTCRNMSTPIGIDDMFALDMYQHESRAY